ncbi:MAG TPA: non-ribosomal peptide synthetase, partial [Pyrinomonadaceae bacterium]
WPQIAVAPADNPTHTACAENSAYVLYTSGSTGQPKGVVSAHRASVNRFAWMWRTYPFSPMEVCCQKTSLSFVDSIWEIFGPLLKGVPLVIIPDEVVKDTQLFINTLSTNRVTRLVLVPSLLRGMLGTGEDLSQQLRHLRYCVCSGETVSVELARSFREQIPCATLINLYGSSEVAADILCYEVYQPDRAGTIPIGKAISNTNVYILDSNFQPTPLGVLGEICVGGEGLARGYLNAVKLTAEKFVAHPFSRVNGGRMFRTGDIGRYLPNGNIEYHGRRDHQVKVRGYRIELGEIEAHLATHPQVHQAVAITRESEPGNQQIVAYVIALTEAPTDNELRAHLRSKLPDYMLPATFVLLDAFPLTSSGKVNRLALPPPTGAQLAAGKDFVAPRTDIEKELASIWIEVLRRERVGVNDNFFEIGGHSLLATQVISRVRKHFELELPLRSMFESPTVAGLATVVELRQKIKAAPVPAMRSRRSASKIEQLSTEEIDSLLSIALSKADLK